MLSLLFESYDCELSCGSGVLHVGSAYWGIGTRARGWISVVGCMIRQFPMTGLSRMQVVSFRLAFGWLRSVIADIFFFVFTVGTMMLLFCKKLLSSILSLAYMCLDYTLLFIILSLCILSFHVFRLYTVAYTVLDSCVWGLGLVQGSPCALKVAFCWIYRSI